MVVDPFLILKSFLGNQNLFVYSFDRIMIAAIWMALSSLMFSLQNVFAKLSEDHVDFWTVTFFRGLVGMFLSIGIMMIKRQCFWKEPHDYRMLCTRGVLGGVTIVTGFLSLIGCSLSEAVVLMSTSPIWSNLLSKQEDRCRCSDSICTAMSIAGILTMTYPIQWGGNSGAFFALCSAWSQAIVNVAIRHMKKEDPELISLFSMSASALLCTPAMAHHTSTRTLSHSPKIVAFLALTGIFSFAGQNCKTISLQLASDLSVLVFRYLDVVFAVLADILLFHHRPSLTKWIGMLLVCIGCIGTLWTKQDRPVLPVKTPPPTI